MIKNIKEFSFIKKLLLLLAVVISFQLLLMGLTYFLFEINLFELDGSEEIKLTELLSRNQLKAMITLNQIVGMLIPALTFLLIIYGGNCIKMMDLHMNFNLWTFPLALFILISSFPLIQFAAQVNLKIVLPEWMAQSASEIAGYIEMMAAMETSSDLLINLLIMAVIPAIVEEVFFRGLIQKELIKVMRNGHWGIVIGAIIFSSMHLQFDGFLPRFLLGLLLGYVYHYSRSLLVPMFVHFANNALMVYILYSRPGSMDENEAVGDMNYIVVIISSILVISLIYLFSKLNPANEHEDLS